MWHGPFQGTSAAQGAIHIELNAFTPSRAFQEICVTNGELIPWTFGHRARGTTGSADVARFIIGGSALGSGAQIVRVSSPVGGGLGTVLQGVGSAAAGANGWTIYRGTYTYTGTTGVQQIGFESVSTASGAPASGNFIDAVQIELTPYLELTGTTFAGDEGGIASLPELRLTGNLTAPLTINLQVGGTAEVGSDYTLNNPVVVPAGNYDGSTPISLGLTILDDTAFEADETITIGLPPGGSDYTVASTASCGAPANASATVTLTNDDPAPADIGSGLRLWLDAADAATIFGDGACTNPAPTSGSDVACWKDKSGSGSDVIDVGAANGEPTWETNQFNGQPALRFSESEADTLRHVLGTPWTSDYTEFLVFQQLGSPTTYDSFFANGDSPSGDFHQITFLNGAFRWFHGTTQLAIEPVSTELKLYAVRGNSSGTEVFADGAAQGSAPDTGGRTFQQYRINQNRGGDRLTNSKIAEVIVYDRALDDCEVESVSLYLGLKYGRDFFDLGSDWSYTAPFDNDVTGISSFQNAPCAARVIDSARSSAATLDTPTGLDPGETLLIGHDGAPLSSFFISGGDVDHRVARLWRVDADQPAAPGIALRVGFDLSQLSGIPANPSELRLLVWDDGEDPGNPALATEIAGATIDAGSNVAHFANVVLEHGQTFTLGHAAPGGLLVQNANAIDYPALGAAVLVAPQVRIAFPSTPGTTIDEAKVDLSENFEAGSDVLEIQGATSGGSGALSWSWDATTGVLSVTGSADAATYEALLRQVTFRNTSGSPSTAQRRVTFSLGSGLQFPDNGHFYEFVPSQFIAWDAARDAAAAGSYFGLQGYLATITSAAEQSFIETKVQGNGWLGGSDSAVEGDWRWITGPEAMADGGAGLLFWRGSGSGGPVGGQYNNWALPTEPNNAGNEDFAHVIGNPALGAGRQARWNDLLSSVSSGPYAPLGYIVEYGGLSSDPVVNLADVALVDVLVPSLQLTKTPAAPAVDVGQPITYTLEVENTGAAPALNLALHETIPNGATFTSASGGGSLSGDTVTWTRPTLAVGATWQETVTIVAPQVPGGMTNTADAGADNAATVQATATVDVTGPRLSLRKLGPSTVAANGAIAYTIVVENTGDGAATTVQVVDTIPPGTTVIDAGGGTPDMGTVTWDIASIPAMSSQSRTLELMAPGTSGTITNSAVAGAANSASDVSASATTYVTQCLAVSAACVTKAFGDASIVINDTTDLAFFLEAPDAGPYNVSFTDALPPGLEVAGTATNTCGATVSGTAAVTVSAVVLDGGTPNCTVTVPVSGTTSGSKINDPSRFSGVADADVSGASATLVVTQPVLELTKTAAPSSVQVGNQVTYTLQYSNTGTAIAENVVLVDDHPAQLTFVSATGGGVDGAGTVTWNLGDLAPGSLSSVTVTYEAPASPTPSLTNAASLSADPPAQGDTATETISVFGEPQFSVSLTDTPDPVLDNTELHYLITVENTGNLAATGTTVSFPIPADTSYVSAPGGNYAVGADTVIWTIGALAVGVPASFTVTVRVDAPLADGTVITANVDADASNLGGGPVTATATTTVISEPQLTVSVDGTPAIVDAGDGITYRVSFSNQGTDVAAASTLTLTVPAPSTISTVDGSGTVTGQTVTWSVGDLQPGESGSHLVTVVTDTGIANGTVLTAGSVISSTTTCGAPGPEAPCTDTDDVSTLVDSAAILALEKTAPSFVADGAALTYELTYRNTGNFPAQNVVLTDVLSPNTAFISATGGGVCDDGSPVPGPCVGPTNGFHRVVWNFGTLGVGAAATVRLTVAVVEPLPDGTPLINRATLQSGGPGGPQPVSATVSTIVTSTPALTLDKTAPLQTAAGGPLLFTLEYRNVGTDTATNVVLTDQLPSNTSFVSASAGGTESAPGVVTWNLGDVSAGAGATVNLVVGVDNGLLDGTLLANNARLTSDTTPPIADQTVTRVLSAPLLSVSKTSSPGSVVAAGGTVNYTIEYRNDGNEDLLDAVLTDHLPAGLAPLTIGGGGTYDSATGNIEWMLGTLPAGGSGVQIFSLAVPLDTPNGSILTNSVTLAGDDGTPATWVQPIVVSSGPVLEMEKTGPAFAAAGSSVSYQVTASNSGNATASNVLVVDQLPPNTMFVTATGAPAVAGNALTWTVGSLPPGGAVTYNIVAAVAEPLANGTVLTNTADVSASNAAPAGDAVVTTVTSAPALDLSKTGPVQVSAGTQMTYTLEYRNIGTDVATGVLLTDFLPAGTSFVSVTGGGSEVTPGVVSWDLGTLGAGAGTTVEVTVAVANGLLDGTPLHNQASIDSLETPPAGADLTTTVVSAPLLSVTKTASPSPLVAPNGQITYTIAVRNDGNEDALNAEVFDLFPPLTTVFAFSNASDPNVDAVDVQQALGFVSWDIGTLAAGESFELFLTVTVPDAVTAPDGTPLVNAVALYGDDAAPASDEATVTVSASPVIRHTKVADVTTVAPGGQVNYTLEVQNVGSSAATGVQLVDQLPPFTTYVGSGPVAGVWDPVSRTVVWDLPDLAPGSGLSRFLTVAVEADPLLTDGAILANQSSVVTDQATPAAASSAVAVTAPVLSLIKNGAPDPVSAGDVLTYTFDFENNGSLPATGLVLIDRLGPDIEFAGLVGPPGVYDPNDRTVTWLLGTLAPGGSGTATLLATVASPLADGTPIVNQAVLTSNEGVGALADVISTVQSAPALFLEKLAEPSSVAPGGMVTWILTVENFGNTQATDVMVTDTLPADLAFVAADSGGIWDPFRRTVTWNLGTLPGNSPPLTLLLETQVGDEPGTVTNVAEVSSVESPPLQVSGEVEVGQELIAIPTLRDSMLVVLGLLLTLASVLTLRQRL